MILASAVATPFFGRFLAAVDGVNHQRNRSGDSLETGHVSHVRELPDLGAGLTASKMRECRNQPEIAVVAPADEQLPVRGALGGRRDEELSLLCMTDFRSIPARSARSPRDRLGDFEAKSASTRDGFIAARRRPLRSGDRCEVVAATVGKPVGLRLRPAPIPVTPIEIPGGR